MVMYRYSKEKFCLGHSLELKGWAKESEHLLGDLNLNI